MGIKRMLRSVIITALIVAIIVTIIDNSRILWKWFGFVFCEAPETITVHSVKKDYMLGCVNIEGAIEDFEGYYSGYTSSIEEGELIIGLKYNKYFGYDEKEKYFSIQVPCELNDIKSIYLVNSANEVKIWPVGGI